MKKQIHKIDDKELVFVKVIEDNNYIFIEVPEAGLTLLETWESLQAGDYLLQVSDKSMEIDENIFEWYKLVETDAPLFKVLSPDQLFNGFILRKI